MLREINIAMVTDINYMKYVPALSKSIRDNSKAKKILIHLVTDISKKQFDDNIVIIKGVEFIHIEIGNKIQKMKSNLERIHSITNARLLIPELISKQRVLYLDIDMLVVREGIDKLFEMDMSNYEIAGVLDGKTAHKHNMKRISNQTRKDFLNIKDWRENYLNAGMIVFNNELSRKNKTYLNAIKYLTEINPNSEFADQDAIYYAYCGKAMILDHSYNSGPQRMNQFPGDPRNAINKPIIAHYFGSNKPWNTKSFPHLAYKRRYKKTANSFVSNDNPKES